MSPNFIQKKIASEETLGKILKKKREELQLSLEEISRKTKIRQVYLSALEENDYESLPYGPYTRGILKKYADSLGLDQNKILNLYERQKGINHYVHNGSRPMPKPISNSRVVITPKTYFIALTIIAFLVIFSYIAYQYRSFATPPELNIVYPSDNMTVETSTITVEGKTDTHADLSINQQPISVEDNGSFKIVINLQNGLNYINITAKNRINKEKDLMIKVMAKLPTKEIPEKQIAKPSSLELSVQINPNSAWLYVETDNKQAYQGIMLPGTHQVFTANDYLSITTRNGGSVELNFNGKNLGKMGAEGEVIKGLRFDKNTKVQ